MATVALRVSGGAKTYVSDGHESPVFSDVDLEVSKGQILVLLGPSGCGKSTLLRAIAGLDELSGGEIDLPRNEAGHRRVGIVFQESLLLPWLTVRENVTLGLNYGAHRHASDDVAVDSVLSEFGLSDLAEAYSDELSGGQAQRVSLARTVVTRPEVVLFDEPFSALDPLTRATMQDWLIGIQQALGVTAIVVTHDVDEAIALGDMVALMSPAPGTVVQTWSVPREWRSGDRGQLVALKSEVLKRYRSLELGSALALNEPLGVQL
jgi:ABC-type nitrate/sulfonate/bicarbonate transport system ATPase subunit